jgi:hypothetical protein
MSLEAPAEMIASGPRLFAISLSGKEIVESPFRITENTREARFGEFKDARHIPMPFFPEGGKAQGIALVEEKLLLLDGERLTVQSLEFQKGEWKTWATGGVPFDLVRPARDRGGEATRRETARLRAALVRAYKTTEGLRFFGMKEVPASWGQDRARHVYMVMSRMRGFSFFLMGCGREGDKSQDGLTQCMLHRACDLEGKDSALPKRFAGFAVDTTRRQIVVAEMGERRLWRYRFESCNVIRPAGTLMLPNRLRQARALHVDDQGNLLVGTESVDDLDGANFYVWPKGQW